jgi:ATP-dependent Zn protease
MRSPHGPASQWRGWILFYRYADSWGREIGPAGRSEIKWWTKRDDRFSSFFLFLFLLLCFIFFLLFSFFFLSFFASMKTAMRASRQSLGASEAFLSTRRLQLSLLPRDQRGNF